MEKISEDLNKKIEYFFISKNINNIFVRNCITEFIVRHSELYGEVVSIDNLLSRLNQNLDKINFVGYSASTSGELGEYIGRIDDGKDQNEIILYSSLDDLDISPQDKFLWDIYNDEDKIKILKTIDDQKRQIKSTLFHELTHAAYTVKDKYGVGEKHIYSVYGKDLISGKYKMIGGNNNNVEAIVNYISSRLEDKKSSEVKTYPYETKAIYMLSRRIDEKNIILSAWNSDEEMFKNFCSSIFEVFNSDNYNNFQKIMKKLVTIRNQNLDLKDYKEQSEEEIRKLENFFEGKLKIENNIKIKDQNENIIKSENNEINFSTDKNSSSKKVSKISEKINYFKQKKLLLKKQKDINNLDDYGNYSKGSLSILLIVIIVIIMLFVIMNL